MEPHMTSQALVNQFRFNQMTLTALLADISQEDGLRTPAQGVNCINWLLGHLLATRGRMMTSMNAEPEWYAEYIRIYLPHEPHYPASAKAMQDMLRTLNTSLVEIALALKTFEPSLGKPTDEIPHLKAGTWADRIGSFICHEAYHCGQIGLARRAMGKKGMF
jgi:hypothetical protein